MLCPARAHVVAIRTLLRSAPLLLAACGDAGMHGGPSSSEASSSSAATDDPSSSPTSGLGSSETSPSTAGSTDTTGSGGSTASGAESSTSSSSGDTTTGTPGCTPRVVVMGYWPPTNEMLRPWSTDPQQNPDGWIGADWGGHGYDVYSFFPEFPPDGDPTNDEIGQDGAVGSPDFDLRVDYQATSADFWRIVDEHAPVIVLTTSRGGDIGWELEAIDGGHGIGNDGDPSLDWYPDGYGDVVVPTEATVDPRTWDAITTYRQGVTLPSQLPLQDIFDATSALGVTDVAIDDTGTSGNFLSGFLGLHGLYYQATTRAAVAAGHIHVGFGLPVADASMLVEATLHALLEAHPADAIACPD